MVESRSFGTHDGSFHADEVTACALLLYFGEIDRDKIVRSRSNDILDKCEYVCDVGGVYDSGMKRFDHHQFSYKGSLSSAGMVLLHLKNTSVICNELYEFLKNKFIDGVDAVDNGRGMCHIGHSDFSSVVSSFMPYYGAVSDKFSDKSFDDALNFVLSYIDRVIQRFRFMQKSSSSVENEMQKNRILLSFDEPIPWMDLFFKLGGDNHPAKFVVMPSSDGGWKLRGIPPHLQDRMSVRIPLPASWGGLSGEALEKASGVSGAVFCHKGLFISTWDTKQSALNALEVVLEVNAPTLFEKMVSGEISVDKVYEDGDFIAINDIHPKASVHILLIPKKHYLGFQSMSDSEVIVALTKIVQMLAEKFQISDNYRLVTNNGEAAGQSIFHLHFHLLGGSALGPIA